MSAQNKYYDEANQFYPEFTKDDIDIFIDGFKKFDEDGSGAIEMGEFEKAMKFIGQGVAPDNMEQIFKELDTDNSGAIDWKEFLQIMRLFYPSKLATYIREFIEPGMRHYPWFTKEELDVFAISFRTFDTDGSGAIDADELTAAFKQMGQGCSPADVKKIILLVDKDKSGDIEWLEYLEIMTTMFYAKKADFNKNILGPATKFLEFTKDEIYDFVFAFRTFDINGDGHIDAKELADMFKFMGEASSEQKAQEIISQVDEDGNGTIEWAEFLGIMRNSYPERKTEFEQKFYGPWHDIAPEFSQQDVDAFILTFRKYDVNGNGSIDTDQLAIALKDMGQGCSPAQLQKILEEFDADGNGTLEWSEFLSMMKKFYSEKPASGASSAAAKPAAAAKAAATSPRASTTPAAASPAASTAPSAIKKPAPAATSGAPAAAKGSNACASCGKTVYPIEEVKAVNQVWHKGCFKCQGDNCNISLTLKTFKAAVDKIYCAKHLPVHKATVTSDSMAMQNATSAPKLNKALGVQKNVRQTFATDEQQ